MLTRTQIVDLYAVLPVFDGEMVPLRNKADEVIGTERKPAPITVTVAMKVARIKAALQAHATRVDIQRTSLIGIATGGKGKIELDDPKYQGVQESMVQFLSEAVEVGDLPSLLLDEIKDCKLAPAHLTALLPVLKD